MEIEDDKQLGYCPVCGEKVYRHLSEPAGSCGACGHDIDWHNPGTWAQNYLATRPAGRKVGAGLLAVGVLMAFSAWFANSALALVFAIVAFVLAYTGISTLLSNRDHKPNSDHK